MESDSQPQYAAVEQPLDSEPPKVHCPICGQQLIQVEGEVPQVNACKHLEFIYTGESGDFEYQSPAFKKRLGTMEPDQISLETLKDTLKKIGYGNTLLAIELTYGGMGCGPVWYTDVYAFDYASLSEES